MFRALKWLILIVSVAFSLLFFLPFAIRFEEPDTRSSVVKHIVYQIVTKECSHPSEDSTARALWKFIGKIIQNPLPGQHPEDIPAMNVLMNKWGSCDQQALLLISFARAHGLDGRLVFLYGEDSISKHSVAEIKTKGHYGMYDPYYGTIFINKRGLTASVEDLKKENCFQKFVHSKNTFQLKGFNLAEYRKLFGRKYPQKIKAVNQMGLRRNFWLHLTELPVKVFGSVFYDFWLKQQCLRDMECYRIEELNKPVNSLSDHPENLPK